MEFVLWLIAVMVILGRRRAVRGARRLRAHPIISADGRAQEAVSVRP